ncbi:MAG: hypothetical protein KAR42_11760 [candidate division Zixibacteria bacterium]|nr:hypothetical protein [candidate division Zixibacteria bacterium]
MLKRAHVYCNMEDSVCKETKVFLEENGVLVTERDISKQPLTKRELNRVLGFHNPKHYLNSACPAFKKNKLDEKIPPREELLKLIAENPELLRQPIIMCGRLMTIGTGKKQLIDMFQIAVSGNGSDRRRHTVAK